MGGHWSVDTPFSKPHRGILTRSRILFWIWLSGPYLLQNLVGFYKYIANDK